MAVLRIVPDLETSDPARLSAWYVALFGMDVLMDQSWIITLGAPSKSPTQISFASEGGAGAPVPHLSIEVDDVDAHHAKSEELGLTVTYPLTDEPWGVRRFFVEDPDGRLINILSHAD
jgi:catechol 2,3-dioxygenase-like lactoylglutathione lyase family enzyme